MVKQRIFFFSFCIFISCQSTQVLQLEEKETIQEIQKDALVNGPMVGYSTMQEVAIWIQGQPNQHYYLQYQDKEGNQFQSQTNQLGGPRDNTTLLIADQLKPGNTYSYEVIKTNSERLVSTLYEVVGEGTFQSQPLWQWRSDPPEFSFAFGSCVYINEPEFDRPGEPYGGDYTIFEQIYHKKPDFMIWGGDNTYLREADWNSMTGIWNRFTHSRAIPEMKELLANTHHYAIWDDHDFGPNNSDRSFFLKDSTYKAFTKFWANPSYGIDGQKGITSKFQWNDCEFFLLDNRYFRTPNDRKTGEKYILGEHQENWLIDNLVNSLASFKFIVIGGQFVNSAEVFENHATFSDERNRIIQLIRDEGIKNVVFLSGDRHHSELSRLVVSQESTIYDITSSPLTSGSYNASGEGNENQIPGSLIGERNFALIDVSGKWENRVLNLTYYNVEGEPLFSYEINQVK